MPPDSPNEQELNLKKRARRRLVGAIALVLLMVIVLPQVLQDRATIPQQEVIAITMPDSDVQGAEVHEALNTAALQADENELTQQAPVEEPIKPDTNAKTDVVEKMITASENAAIKETEKKGVETKVAQSTAQQNKKEAFTIQVGVYSDAANVKRLQHQLKQSGFNTYTEKVMTSKGESTRLKAGNFTSREDAVAALAKLKALGLSGIVVSNE